MSKYLLPCACGKGMVIEASQAGQQITCGCGALLEVPTLRGVRALEPVQETTPTARPAADWDSSRGLIFAGSLVLLVIGAGLAYLGYEGLRTTPKISREDESQTAGKAIDEMSLDEVYDAWNNIREHGLGPRGQNIYVNIRGFRAGRQRILTIGIALGVVGLLGAVGATLGRRKSSV